ncbi:MAG: leucine-rich repeat domain-containing protein [Bacteroidales bacterium]|nr:leucine-rich repeat domain-containing protein [Bacteroidales bacterium]
MDRIDIKNSSTNSYDVHYYDYGLFENIPDVGTENIVSVSKGSMFTYNGCLYKLEGSGEITLLNTWDAAGRLIIPMSIQIGGKEYPVTRLGSFTRCKYTFVDYHNDKRRKPTTSEGIITVGAFWGSKVTECIIPPSIREIEEVICGGVSHYLYATLPDKCSLKEIVFSDERPSELKTIGNATFYNCHLEMGTLKLPEGLRKIGDNAFSGDFSKIVFPSTLESIGESAFYHCSIKSMKLPDGIEYLGPNFVDLYHFTEPLEIPSSVKTIPQLEWSLGERWDLVKELPSVIIHNGKKDVTVDKVTRKYCRIQYIDAQGNKKKHSNWIRNLVFKTKKPESQIYDSGRRETAKEYFDGRYTSAVVISLFFVFMIVLMTVLGILIGIGVLE